MNDTNKILLILDLDETLIHATSDPVNQNYHFTFNKYFVYKRPHLKWFLENAALDFDLAIWSSADDTYVQNIVDLSGLSDIDIKFIWGRSKCTTRRNFDLDEYVHEKRLKKVKKLGYSLEKMLIVDDSPEKTKENYGNAVYIKPFKGSEEDHELKKLLDYLKTIKDSPNVRTIEKRGWSNINLFGI